MMCSIFLKMGNCYFILYLTLLVVGDSLAQARNPASYPYGGISDSSRTIDDYVCLNFSMAANFNSLKFDTLADFRGARFDSLANFSDAQFEDSVDFEGTNFKSRANFSKTQFNNSVNFKRVVFDNRANFQLAHFYGPVYFSDVRFSESTDFIGTHFNSFVNFERAKFDTLKIRYAQFDSLINFRHASFNRYADFRSARIESLNLAAATIVGDFVIGFPEWEKADPDWQRFDFTKTVILDDGKIELNGLVELKIQPEKIKHISLGKRLGFFLKKDIIENLKNKSFTKDKRAQFELDYVFAKSTMFQGQDHYFRSATWHWWIVNTLYFCAMGLGYRPFWLAGWVFGLIILFTLIYRFKFPYSIDFQELIYTIS